MSTSDSKIQRKSVRMSRTMTRDQAGRHFPISGHRSSSAGLTHPKLPAVSQTVVPLRPRKRNAALTTLPPTHPSHDTPRDSTRGISEPCPVAKDDCHQRRTSARAHALTTDN